jgi:hypothetical protein
MYVKRLASAAAIATGVGISALTFGVGPVNAAPSDPPPPPPCPTCELGPGQPGNGPQDNPAEESPDNQVLEPQRVGPAGPHGGQSSIEEPDVTPAPAGPDEPGP